MSEWKFEPSDFAMAVTIEGITSTISQQDKETIAERANAKLQKWLSQAKVVEAVKMENGSWYASTNGCLGKTHKALLISIEPIEKCNHPKEKVIKENWQSLTFHTYKCECGAQVKPSGFEVIKNV